MLLFDRFLKREAPRKECATRTRVCCVLHIGTEKTGTSTIQRFLSKNRELLRAEGVLYPSAGGGENGGSQWGFAASACHRPWEMDIGRFLGVRSEVEADLYRDALASTLREDLQRGPAVSKLVISSEHFHSRVRSVDEIRALRASLADVADEYRVVLYLRRQDRLAVSLYSTQIKSGNHAPRVFMPLNGPVPYYYNYEVLYQNWSDVFGAEAVTVRIFDRAEFQGGDLLQDFCDVCNLELEGKWLPGVENESLDQAGAAFLMEVNRQLGVDETAEADALRRRIAQAVAGIRGGRVFPVSRDQAKRFYARFTESNERMRAHLFPDRDRPLFNDEFDDYPEEVVPVSSSYEDAVRIAIDLFGRRDG